MNFAKKSPTVTDSNRVKIAYQRNLHDLCRSYKDIVDEKAPRLIGVVKEVKVVEENNTECQTGVKYFPGRHGTTAAKIPVPCN